MGGRRQHDLAGGAASLEQLMGASGLCQGDALGDDRFDHARRTEVEELGQGGTVPRTGSSATIEACESATMSTA
jgi:hypothetical protein